MTSPVRVKVTVEHLREELHEYLEAEATDRATTIANAIHSALETFDFDAALERIANQELEKFVQQAAAAYFKRLLTSPEAHAAILDTLATTMKGDK